MKKLIIAFFLVLGIASCNKPTPTVDTVGDQNKEVVKKFIEAAVKGDTSNLEGFMTEKAMFYGPGLNDSTARQQEVDFWKKGWKNDWASIEFNRAAITSFRIPAGERFPGDWVSDWATWTVNFKTGKPPVTFWWNGVFRIKDGKIEVARAFYNLNDFFTQQGYTVTPPAPKVEEKK